MFEAKIAGAGAMPVELAPEGRLDGEVLEDRLDHEVGIGDAREVGGGFDARERGVAVLLAEPALGHGPIQVAGDPVPARPRRG